RGGGRRHDRRMLRGHCTRVSGQPTPAHDGADLERLGSARRHRSGPFRRRRRARGVALRFPRHRAAFGGGGAGRASPARALRGEALAGWRGRMLSALRVGAGGGLILAATSLYPRVTEAALALALGAVLLVPG